MRVYEKINIRHDFSDKHWDQKWNCLDPKDARWFLYGANYGVTMPLSHDTDLATIRTRSRTDVAFDHGAIALLHHHGTKLATFAGWGLITSCASSFRENPLKGFPKFSVENTVDDRIKGRVTIAEPRENLFKKKRILSAVQKITRMFTYILESKPLLPLMTLSFG